MHTEEPVQLRDEHCAELVIGALLGERVQIFDALVDARVVPCPQGREQSGEGLCKGIREKRVVQTGEDCARMWPVRTCKGSVGVCRPSSGTHSSSRIRYANTSGAISVKRVGRPSPTVCTTTRQHNQFKGASGHGRTWRSASSATRTSSAQLPSATKSASSGSCIW